MHYRNRVPARKKIGQFTPQAVQFTGGKFKAPLDAPNVSQAAEPPPQIKRRKQNKRKNRSKLWGIERWFPHFLGNIGGWAVWQWYGSEKQRDQALETLIARYRRSVLGGRTPPEGGPPYRKINRSKKGERK